MGPSLARLARRAADKAGLKKRVIAVARYSNARLPSEFAACGIEAIAADLLEPGELEKLPNIPNVIYMAAKKFGTSGAEHETWAMNTFLPGLVANRFRDSRIVAFSTGNVYPLRSASEGGADESTPVAPVGEYAQSALGRERMFEYASAKWGTPVAMLRLNYAIDLRYGVLLDIGQAVYERRPVDLRMPLVNVIWQGDANSWCLRSFAHCQSPPFVLNITGPETLSVREIAVAFGRHFAVEPQFSTEPGALRAVEQRGESPATLRRDDGEARGNDRVDRELDSGMAAQRWASRPIFRPATENSDATSRQAFLRPRDTRRILLR